MSEHLEHFTMTAADDELKIDLELIHDVCGEHVCDVEHGDTIAVLSRTALGHLEECRGDADQPLDVWLRIPEGEEEAEAEANTYAPAGSTGYRVDWSLTAVGLVKSVHFDTLDAAHAFLEREGFADYSS